MAQLKCLQLKTIQVAQQEVAKLLGLAQTSSVVGQFGGRQVHDVNGPFAIAI